MSASSAGDNPDAWPNGGMTSAQYQHMLGHGSDLLGIAASPQSIQPGREAQAGRAGSGARPDVTQGSTPVFPRA